MRQAESNGFIHQLINEADEMCSPRSFAKDPARRKIQNAKEVIKPFSEFVT